MATKLLSVNDNITLARVLRASIALATSEVLLSAAENWRSARELAKTMHQDRTTRLSKISSAAEVMRSTSGSITSTSLRRVTFCPVQATLAHKRSTLLRNWKRRSEACEAWVKRELFARTLHELKAGTSTNMRRRRPAFDNAEAGPGVTSKRRADLSAEGENMKDARLESSGELARASPLPRGVPLGVPLGVSRGEPELPGEPKSPP
mmetsp:Transcript_71030/g.179765  ORF Transcript_71030/g.179765 Transcript_71030/m.179765 type:complete len:207 (+) Transcript_71030:580-1200(+)